jgi:hypothetical protein
MKYIFHNCNCYWLGRLILLLIIELNISFSTGATIHFGFECTAL